MSPSPVKGEGLLGFFRAPAGLCPAAEFHRLDDAFDRYDIGGLTHVDVVLLRRVEDRMVGGGHFFVKALVDVFRLPVVHIKILDHLEVGDGYAARVTEEVGDDVDAVLVEDLIGLGGRGTVGELGDDLRPDPRGVFLGDHVFQCRGEENVHVQFEELRIADRLRAREAADRGGLRLVLRNGFPVEPAFVHDATFRVADGDNLGAEPRLREEGRVEAGVAETLDGDRCLRQVDPQLMGRLANREEPTAGCRVAAAGGAAKCEGLPGDGAKLVPAGDLRKLVHHPGHHLRGGVDIRGRHILLRADDPSDLVDVGPAQPLLFTLGHLLGVADHAALPAAQRQVEQGTLPGHPGGQRADGVYGLIGMETDSTLAGSLGVVVLDAESLEYLYRSVVHADRNRNVEFARGHPQDRLNTGIQMEYLCALVELPLCYCKRINLGHKLFLSF